MIIHLRGNDSGSQPLPHSPPLSHCFLFFSEPVPPHQPSWDCPGPSSWSPALLLSETLPAEVLFNMPACLRMRLHLRALVLSLTPLVFCLMLLWSREDRGFLTKSCCSHPPRVVPGGLFPATRVDWGKTCFSQKERLPAGFASRKRSLATFHKPYPQTYLDSSSSAPHLLS